MTIGASFGADYSTAMNQAAVPGAGGDNSWLRPETWGSGGLFPPGTPPFQPAPPPANAPPVFKAATSATASLGVSSSMRAALDLARNPSKFRAALSSGVAGSGGGGATLDRGLAEDIDRRVTDTVGTPLAIGIAVGAVVVLGGAFLLLRKR